MKLTDAEKAMLDGEAGAAKQRAMDLLVRYGEALGAERLVAVSNVAGTWNAASPAVAPFADAGGMDAVFSKFNLDADDVVETPQAEVYTCQLIHGIDTRHAAVTGVPEAAAERQREAEKFFGQRGVVMFNTCTPYQVGNVPVRGEHCAWMESSAVVYCNAVLGARTNTEGRESTGAASITGRIPDWGYHLRENRFGTHRVDVEVDVDTMMDWGLLGYYVGEIVEEDIPVLSGIRQTPSMIKLKHFGAASASSGGVEMYHIPGVTPEADTVEEAFGGRAPVETLRYGAAERRQAYEWLNNTASSDNVDFIMLGCPHASVEQVRIAARMLEGKRLSDSTQLWMFTPRALKDAADLSGYTEIIERAGGHVLSDTCPGDRARAAEGDEGGRHGFRQAGALPAGDHGDRMLVRLHRGLHRCRTHRPLAREHPMSEVLDTIVIRGRKVVGGVAEGEALVTRDTISGWGGIDAKTGTIIEKRHELNGVSFKDKVLLFPGAKGSSGYSHYFHIARVNHATPKAMIFTKMTAKAALGCVVARVPAMTDFDRDPFDVIETGDWVKVDADNGVIEVTKNRAR